MIELHIDGKLALINPEFIAAVLPPKKGRGCLVCETFSDGCIQVDESVDEVSLLIAQCLEVEIVANDV